MQDQPGWLTEIKWILSAVFAMLAILVLFWGLTATWGSITAPREAQGPAASGADYIGNVLTWAIVGPMWLITILPLYCLGSLLGFRLMVPTFAGLPARLVGVVSTTWPIGLGALYVFADPLGKLLITAIGVAWGLLIPLPRKTLLEYGPVIGGFFIGVGFIALSWWVPGNLTCAVIWTAWRLYKRQAEEVLVTAICAASLPGIVALRDLSSVGHGMAVAFATLQVMLLLAIAIAAAIMATLRPEPESPATQQGPGSSPDPSFSRSRQPPPSARQRPPADLPGTATTNRGRRRGPPDPRPSA
jgi:hypothetical protein